MSSGARVLILDPRRSSRLCVVLDLRIVAVGAPGRLWTATTLYQNVVVTLLLFASLVVNEVPCRSRRPG